MSNKIDIDAELAICEAATDGPWQDGEAGNCNVVSFNTDDIIGVAHVSSMRNARFIARARTGYPATLHELHKTRQEIKRLRARVVEERGDRDYVAAERDAASAEIERLRALLDEATEMGLADYESAAYYARLHAIRAEGGLKQ
jgi:hypothetical protein